jgi:hypothetical protein
MYKDPSFKQRAVMEMDEGKDEPRGNKPVLMKGATYHEK